jgi:hypothetical protein
MKTSHLLLLVGTLLILAAVYALTHRYTFHGSSDGMFLYRCDHFTGAAHFADARNREWRKLLETPKSAFVPPGPDELEPEPPTVNGDPSNKPPSRR